MNSEQIHVRADSDAFELSVLIARLLAKRWWIVGCVLLFSIVFGVIGYATTPVYRASVLIIPASADRNGASGALSSALGQLGGLASLAGLGVGGDSGTEEALAVLRSREFTGKFIDEKRLMAVLFADKWDADKNRWRNLDHPPTSYRAVKYFDEKVRTVTQDRKTGLVTVQVDWTDREVAAEWANELVSRINAEMRTRAIAKADASLGFLQKELMATSVLEVREAINRLVEAQVKQRMLANVTQEYSFRILDKAVAPDPDKPVKPRRMLLLAAGIIAGFIMGVLVALIDGKSLRTSLRSRN